MKNLRTLSIVTTAGAFALGLVFITPTFAQQSADSKKAHEGATSTASKSPAAASSSDAQMGSPSSAAKLQVATNDAKDRTDAKLTGREVKGSDGKDLGNIKDFLVSPTTGKVEFAVVSTGGVAGIGDKLRLVPMAMLRRAGEKDFSVAIAKANWDQIAPFTGDAYKADTIMLTEAEHRQISSHFGGAKAEPANSGSMAALPSDRLLKASDLHGKEVRSAGRDVGKIDGLVIDLDQATAQALFDPKRDFAGTTQKFIVPLNQFVITGRREAASALLTREALDEAAGHSTVSSSSSGTLPVASNTNLATPENPAANATTNTDRDARVAATSANSNDKNESQDVASATGKNSSRQSSPAPAQENVASNSDSSRQKDSTAPSAGGTTTSDISLSRTDRADTNGVNPAAVATNSTPSAANNPEAAAQADAKSPTNSPPNRSEQGQDIASTVPASPSSKAGSAEQPSNAPAISSATAQTATGLAANSTPSHASTTESNSKPASPSMSDQNLTPTGKTSADQLPSNDPALNSAALAIRKALDGNPSLARLNVAVTPESGKVVLRGSVASSQLKTAVEDTARRAAKDKMIDSEVTIEGQ